jgi:hypothetical protein
MKTVKLLSLTCGCICIFGMLSVLVCNCFKSLDNTETHLKESTSLSNISSDECLELAQESFLKHKYKKSFAMLKNLCKEHHLHKACRLIYMNYATLSDSTASRTDLISPYEVLYYLDLGCKNNDMEACMISANIYDSGLRRRHHFRGRPDGKLSLIDFDKKKASFYFSKVCNTKSAYTFEACNRLDMLRYDVNVNAPYARVLNHYFKRVHQVF